MSAASGYELLLWQLPGALATPGLLAHVNRCRTVAQPPPASSRLTMAGIGPAVRIAAIRRADCDVRPPWICTPREPSRPSGVSLGFTSVGGATIRPSSKITKCSPGWLNLAASAMGDPARERLERTLPLPSELDHDVRLAGALVDSRADARQILVGQCRAAEEDVPAVPAALVVDEAHVREAPGGSAAARSSASALVIGDVSPPSPSTTSGS